MITYLKGDATQPKFTGTKIIAHVVNDQGGWGAGFVLAISKRWFSPEEAYRKWHKTQVGFQLGKLQLVQIEPSIVVANMLAQKGYASKGYVAIQYDALHKCLNELAAISLQLQASIHMPRIGCGLAGGSWNKVEALMEPIFKDIPTFVYDL